MGAGTVARLVGVLSVLSGLLAVVAVASRGALSSHAAGGGSIGDVRVTLSVLVVLAALAAVLALVLLVVLMSLFGAMPRRRSPDADLVARHPPIAGWTALPVLALVVAFALAAVVVIGVLGQNRIHPQAPVPRQTAAAASGTAAGALAGAPGAFAGSGLELSTGVLVAASALVVLLIVIAVGLGLRARAVDRSAAGAADAVLATAIEEAIAGLAPGSGLPSARQAVIEAYVRMQRALSERSLAHRASEAPREYLARARAILGGGGQSAARLTELFEEARFSPHEIGESMRGEAIAALAALRDELGQAGGAR